MANELTLVGYGAGKYETAGAVISDIMSICRHNFSEVAGKEYKG